MNKSDFIKPKKLIFVVFIAAGKYMVAKITVIVVSKYVGSIRIKRFAKNSLLSPPCETTYAITKPLITKNISTPNAPAWGRPHTLAAQCTYTTLNAATALIN
jgi:hypothetical protein